MKQENTGRPILVIEDEPSVMSYVRTALERSGYEVMTVDSGAGALEMLRNGEYHGVISDMRTPGGVDGSDVHDWIKANRPELHDRLIFITGDIVNEETAATLRRTGAPHLEKPFRVRQLLDVVERTLGRNL
ncbi:MAG TPA: response regulator [Terriglobales bacterium]|jgi:DNA-binding NtrC family response regulator|nr:response regulator [Terriglobales bacterium]